MTHTKYVVTVELEPGETYNGESYYQDFFDTEEEVREHYAMEDNDYDGFTDSLLVGEHVLMDGRGYQLSVTDIEEKSFT